MVHYLDLQNFSSLEWFYHVPDVPPEIMVPPLLSKQSSRLSRGGQVERAAKWEGLNDVFRAHEDRRAHEDSRNPRFAGSGCRLDYIRAHPHDDEFFGALDGLILQQSCSYRLQGLVAHRIPVG